MSVTPGPDSGAPSAGPSAGSGRRRTVGRPVEPPPTGWVLPTRDQLVALPSPSVEQLTDAAGAALDQGPDDLVARGADLEPGTLLAAYRAGMFPMPVGGRGGPAWWSPVRRGVLEPAGLKIARSLRRTATTRWVTVDRDFPAVIAACARIRRPGGWISDHILDAYTRLHELGWAHSVETRTGDGELVGGLYGLAIGGLFAGESMFHAPGPAGRDASKVALVHLCALLSDAGPGRLVDVQWVTPHLAGLGVRPVTRRDYLERLPRLLAMDLPAALTG